MKVIVLAGLGDCRAIASPGGDHRGSLTRATSEKEGQQLPPDHIQTVISCMQAMLMRSMLRLFCLKSVFPCTIRSPCFLYDELLRSYHNSECLASVRAVL